MLVQLLMSLSWQSLLVLHEQELDTHLGRSLEASAISYVDYDISYATEEDMMTILKDVEQVFLPNLNVFLLCDVTTTVSVLRQMAHYLYVNCVHCLKLKLVSIDQSRLCGTPSNSSVDWCHVSRVLVVGTSDDLPVLLDSNILVENVALAELNQERFTRPRMWTLMFHANGRGFADVDHSGVATSVREVFPNVRFGYNGRQLTVVMKTHSWAYGYKTVNKRNVSSLSFHILQMMAENLNFSYTIIPPKESVWGKNENGSWTGVLGMLQRREADLSADHFTIHVDRYSVADFILPPVFENKRFVLFRKEEPDEGQLLVFLRPFQSRVFMLVGVSLFVSSILMFSARLIASRGRSKDRIVNSNMRSKNDDCLSCGNKTELVVSTSLQLYGACLRQGSIRHSSHFSELILISGWWMFSTVISAVYCGTIVAIFAVKLEKPPFSNLAELAAREDYKIGYDPSSITENLFQNTKHSDVREVVQRVRGVSVTDPGVLSINVTEHLQRVQKGKYAFISGTVMLPLGYADCTLDILDTNFGHSYTAFHLPKYSPFKQDLENTMFHLHDSGILQRTFQKWIQSAPQVQCSPVDFPKAVSLIKVQSIFIAIGVGLICSFLMLLAEIVWYMMHRKTR